MGINDPTSNDQDLLDELLVELEAEGKGASE